MENVSIDDVKIFGREPTDAEFAQIAIDALWDLSNDRGVPLLRGLSIGGEAKSDKPDGKLVAKVAAVDGIYAGIHHERANPGGPGPSNIEYIPNDDYNHKV